MASVAPDGDTLLLTRQDGTFQRSSLGAGGLSPIPALQPLDHPIGWSRDSRAVYVQKNSDVPVHIERVELETSRRTLALEIEPEGTGPIATLYVTDWREDGRWYVYNYTLLPSTLFVVTRAID